MKIESKPNMDITTNNLVSIISQPSVGITAGFGAGFTAFLSWCGVITIIFGMIATVLGAIIAALHLYYYLKSKHQGKKNPENELDNV